MSIITKLHELIDRFGPSYSCPTETRIYLDGDYLVCGTERIRIAKDYDTLIRHELTQIIEDEFGGVKNFPNLDAFIREYKTEIEQYMTAEFGSLEVEVLDACIRLHKNNGVPPPEPIEDPLDPERYLRCKEAHALSLKHVASYKDGQLTEPNSPEPGLPMPQV